MSSSSGELPPPYDAVVQRGEHGLGPVRLPLEEQQRFIDEFNERYGPMGISVAPIVPANSQPSESGVSLQAAASDSFTAER